jgi:hypothetical protein
LASYRQTPGNATDYFSRTAKDLQDMMRFGHVLERRVPGFSRDLWRARIRRHAEWGMNKWRLAGDEDAVLLNQKIWRRLALPEERLCLRLEAARKFAQAFAAKHFRSLIRPFHKHSTIREVGRTLERSVRRFVRRGRTKAAGEGAPRQESRSAA